MNMPVDVVRMFLFLVDTEGVVGHIGLVPILHVLQDFGADVSFFIQEVTPFVNVDDDMEESFDALARAAYGGHHGHAYQFAQGQVIQFISASFQLVEHVESDDHAHVHVYQLSSEIKVALQIGGIHHVDDDVRRLVDDVLAHVEFLGRVGGERVGARQVNDAEVVALEVEVAFLSIHGDPAVVSHTLM